MLQFVLFLCVCVASICTADFQSHWRISYKYFPDFYIYICELTEHLFSLFVLCLSSDC